ncbi:Cys-rich peptide radical SAM maturase CcpM [Ruminiclostridium herbifermentans]|uniref:Cys-rich peptide radical SAM maturase CcpM n=1 Tax=Ruminiclostridium herbifermentans TaxID=2488810 RepID=A0A4U7JFA3_9FIRM|nr:Cys-rich peptide radical SAM maturase CcpM [Ruminiclostridium herbifermentans]QNU67842.1 Cys-rich peptide radical SAM maturase CcpM [Ruminiclostridium herbifermentans]
MLELKPFIYPFCTAGGYYIYDVNTSKIIKVSKEAYDYLNGKTNEIQLNTENEVNKMIKNGFLSNNKVKEILHPASKNLNDILDSTLEKIILQVTQQCNLRCEYCIYSGDSGHYQNRRHQSKRMNFDIAKKGIDFLIEHSQGSKNINVGFYGGEPLLEFELIKKCVEYAKEQAEGKELSFSITTNATLLNEDVIKYLYENDIMLSISLDGPREIHNNHRKFAGSGEGSFDKIMENMENLKRKYPEYFKNILFNVVVDPMADFKCISEFFMNYDMVKDITQMSTLPSTNYLEEPFSTNENFRTEYRYEFFKVFLHKLGRLEKKYVSKLNLFYFDRLKSKYTNKRTLTLGLSDYGHPGGPCIPGQMRLFMDTDGVFYPCERVSEASEVMKIGNVEDGFDLEKCFRILNVAKVTEESCKNCWAFRYCNQCAAFADDTKELTSEKRLKECVNTKREIEEQLKDFCTLLELGYNFDEEEEPIVQFTKKQLEVKEDATETKVAGISL